MAMPSVDHKFNDDLLLLEEDRKLASIKYPTIFHVLDHPQLRQLFSKYDVPANRAKRIGLIAGFGASGSVSAHLGLPLSSSVFRIQQATASCWPPSRERAAS